ncbi:MAG TPA: SIS domain-containing protein [Lichenihabitans sp.]|jgi:glucosamine--fructose-6-phosphate aminotransferase (isomerizing)|nr:SIS domain-containing protein [Lichenihabitans sp.]
MTPTGLLTPLLAPGSPLEPKARALVAELFEREARLMDALPTDDPLDEKRRRRVDLTRIEILAQPAVIRDTLAKERANVTRAAQDLAKAGLRRIVMTGCGDSLAVMIAARLLFERVLGLPCEPIQALDFAYYTASTIGPDTLVITLSSSGTTTRTVEAALMAGALGSRTLALSNTPGSALMVESDQGLLVRAERRGWPTQASTAALALLMQFALDLGSALGRPADLIADMQAALDAVPDQIAEVIAVHEDGIAALARHDAARATYLFAGGGPAYACALFGAAKVKECSPDHAIAIPLEEFHHYNSHKPGDPLFIIAPRGPSVARARDTAFEGKRWGGRVYGIVADGETALGPYSDAVFHLPVVPEEMCGLVYCVPVQLFAYHLAMAKFAAAAAAPDPAAEPEADEPS